MNNLKFLFYLLVIVLLNFKTFAKSSEIRFIIAGHLYPIVHDKEKFKNFVEKINSYKPDYLFILGDSEIQDKDVFNKYLQSFNSKLFFSPGNHELKKSKNEYLKNVGYLNHVIEEENIRFILINSSEDSKKINKTLNKFLKKDFKNGPTIILTHHRIWDDTLISQNSYKHDKSFFFDQIYPTIKNDVKYIFSGNSKRQYFRDFKNSVTFGKQNINNILWFDKIGSINAYSVGMGDGTPKANFTIVDTINGELIVKGDYSTTKNYDILPRHIIEADKHKLLEKYTKKNYFFINKEKFYLSLILFLVFIVFVFLTKKFKKG